MNVKVYYIDCLTNLHVGSGDANFNIVDKEVEKDPVTGYPIVHASGIKGALREAYRKNHSEKETEKIFGKPATENESDTGGSYKFFDARFLYRPVRAQGSVPSVNVTTVEAIREFAQLTKAFGIDIGLDTGVLDKITFPAGNQEINFLTSHAGIRVEGETCGTLNDAAVRALKPFLGNHFAVAASLDGYDLPVIARNCLQEKKRNLWYEEFVPHGSRFYMLAIIPENAAQDEIDAVIPKIAQIGGNCSVGYGYCEFGSQFGRQEA